ncbi:hypothetical protein SH528x_007058 [Novipirellula sp. SH528]|uniref:hypothetical protein n=1 Tax=Novipirellula sp. SH528 TaxID=3454466 RepID=UPI003FA110DB
MIAKDTRGAVRVMSHVEIVSGTLNEEMNRDETMTLDKLPNTVASSRLACQIMTDELIDSMVFRVLGDV